MSDLPEILFGFIFDVLTMALEERGVFFYGLLIFIVGIGVAVFWPFGSTPIDVLTGYAIVVSTVLGIVGLIKWFFHSIN